MRGDERNRAETTRHQMDTGQRIRGQRCEKGKHSPRTKTRKIVGKVLNTTSVNRSKEATGCGPTRKLEIRDDWFLDDKIPRHKLKKGYVRGQVESIRWEENRDREAYSSIFGGILGV